MPAIYLPQQSDKSFKNKLLIQKLNEAFSSGNKEFIAAHISDNIKWNIVGMPRITGREDFLKVLKIMESAVGGFPGVCIKNMISEGDYVVVESSGGERKSVKSFSPSYCEVYRIKNEKIMELTTYVVDAEVNQ